MATIELIHDGDCLICKRYAWYVKVKEKHTLLLKDAREDSQIVSELLQQGIDINDGMVARIDGALYQGVDAVRAIDNLSNNRNWYHRILGSIMHSSIMSILLYPLAKVIRRLLLIIQRKSVKIPVVHLPSKEKKTHVQQSDNNERLGLVLGGGSAKGIIHIGVIQYLLEHDISPDEIVGTSMGAIIGAGFALGMNAQEMRHIIQEFSLGAFADFHWGKGLLKGDKVYHYLNTLFDHRTFADCIIPLKVISTDITTGESIVHKEGNIAKAVRASLSLPGIFEPVISEGRLLVDGGLTSNLPVEYCDLPQIIAVSTLGGVGQSEDIDIDQERETVNITETKKETKTATKPLIKAVTKAAASPTKSIRDYFRTNKRILSQSVGMLIKQNETLSLTKLSTSPLLIRPDISGYDFMDFDKYEKLIQLGYEEASRVLASYTQNKKERQ